MTGRSPDFKAPLARLSYANLFKPRKRENKDGSVRESYEANFVWPKNTDISALKAAVLAAAADEWGEEKAKDLLKKELIKQPILDGDGKQGRNKEGEQYKELAGCYFVRAATKIAPALFSRQVTAANEKDDLYSGCYVYPVLHAYTWESAEQGKGVSIGMTMVQMAKDGDRLGGNGGERDPSKFFERIDTGEDGGPAGGDKPADGAGGLFS
jgi:hypothetical protein